MDSGMYYAFSKKDLFCGHWPVLEKALSLSYYNNYLEIIRYSS